MVATLLEPQAERIGQLLDQALTAIETAFPATQTIRFSDGQILEVPDHRLRLEAAGLFLRLLATRAPWRLPHRRIPLENEDAARPTPPLSKAEGAPCRSGRAHHKFQLEAVRSLIRIFAKLPPYADDSMPSRREVWKAEKSRNRPGSRIAVLP